MGITHHLPTFQTLHTKPTWHNRAGRVDRSACTVLTAAQLWRNIHPEDWTYRVKPSSNASTDAFDCGVRRDAAPRLSQGLCDRYATLTLTARDLWQLHKREQPHPLRGDFRSPKANAMRVGVGSQVLGLGSMPSPQNPAPNTRNPVNPNRGVGFNMYKMLGLDCLWQTTLTIHRIVQHHKLKQHFIVCPVCSEAVEQRLDGQTAMNTSSTSRPSSRCSTAAKDPKLPGGRVTKLYLPLCTPQEYDDGQLAQLWLKTHCHPNRPLTPDAVQLIERYSELFEPRNLRCRRCLGLRYGEVKPSSNAATVAFSQPPTHSRADTTQHPKPNTEPPTQTEQSLFLTNLPKLLACPQSRPRAKPKPPTNASADHPPAPTASQQTVADLPQPIRDQLLRLLTRSLPAFKRLEKTKQQPEQTA